MMIIYSPFMLLCFTLMVLSSLMAMSSSNWLFVWASMEVNLLSFIPIILQSKENQETEGSIKYFTAQAFGSALLLMSSSMLWSQYSIANKLMPVLLMFSIILKLGMAPCHMWFPPTMNCISWLSCMLLSTWQKLAPLSILIFMISMNNVELLILISAMNALIGGILGMNQSQMRPMMAYSSMGHMGWMISMLTIIMPLASIMYFIMYTIIIIPMFIVLNKLNIKTTKSMGKLAQMSPLSMTIMAMLLMSLGGLPPFTGFFPKLMVINMLMMSNMTLSIVLIGGSLMNLFFYLNIVISMLTINSNKTPMLNTSKYHISNLMMMIMALMSLLLMPVINML